MSGLDLNLQARGEAQRCPYCRDQLSGKVRSCQVCGTLLHLDCWEELDVCPAAGCVGRPKRMRPPAQRTTLAQLRQVRSAAHACLLRRAAFHVACVVAGLAALLGGPLVFLDQQGLSSLLGLLLVPVGLAALVVAGPWLIQLLTLKEVISRVGESADYERATLFVEARQEDLRTRRYAHLVFDRGGAYFFKLGPLLSPEWLLHARDEPVRLWNFRGATGHPFVIERISDGALAPTSL